MAPFTESSGGPSRVYLVDGARLFAITNPADVVTNADVILPLPSDWKPIPLQRNVMIRDLDGDGYGDFAIGENISTGAGRLAVFW
jgi:FG-GAP repeat